MYAISQANQHVSKPNFKYLQMNPNSSYPSLQIARSGLVLNQRRRIVLGHAVNYLRWCIQPAEMAWPMTIFHSGMHDGRNMSWTSSCSKAATWPQWIIARKGYINVYRFLFHLSKAKALQNVNARHHQNPADLCFVPSYQVHSFGVKYFLTFLGHREPRGQNHLCFSAKRERSRNPVQQLTSTLVPRLLWPCSQVC